MNGDDLSLLTAEGFRLLATVGGPIFGILLGVGLTVGVLQSATQINDPSVGFVPKLAAALMTLALLGGWVVSRLVDFLVLALQHVASRG